RGGDAHDLDHRRAHRQARGLAPRAASPARHSPSRPGHGTGKALESRRRATMLKRLISALALGALVLVPAAFADAVFHSTHAPLSPVGEAPLRSGFVQINHMDGPINFAHDNYVVNRASPDATYTV